ncbi:probable G-protein coupled receptor 158 isoform X1 [Limulus polyphemus]|uniref:Probable G-protein coupled receptor 158 isoform X1 n=1 Tax=Limulus polyphemus TaxID=6850 RepID=A0ABM1T3Q3_LIMPO|nr:probable G-protein coupled receptor 158 isoform X1 [Limulus polyphemus]
MDRIRHYFALWLFLTAILFFTRSHLAAKSSHLRDAVRRQKLDDLSLAHFDADVLRLLQKEDYVSAVLHYIELMRNRSASHNCSTTSLKTHFKYPLSNHSYKPFEKQARAALKTSNILNNLFIKASNETEVLYNEAFYYSLVTVNVESDVVIIGSTIAFKKDAFISRNKSSLTFFAPYAFRQNDHVATKDLSKSYKISYDTEGSVGNEWFWVHSEKNISQFLLQKYGPEFSQYYSGLLDGNKDLLVGIEDGQWTSPYFDCGGENTWIISFSAPFFGRQEDDLIFKGVSMVSIDLSNVDIDQCSEDRGMFAGTHKCETQTTECVPISGMGFRRGAYKCCCREGYFFPNGTQDKSVNCFEGTAVEKHFVASLLNDKSVEKKGLKYPESFTCLPCKPGCASCVDDSPCSVEYNILLRSIALGLQSFCTTITIVLTVVVFRLRKSKMISSSIWILLETLLLGAVLLYQTMVIRYFEPSVVTCLAEPWFRELGFAIFYGTIVLKVYRILAEFQTRRAHRVCVRNRDLLKYLLGVILVVVGYMAAWTAVVVDSTSNGHNVLEEGRTVEGLIFFTCRALWWDYVTEVGELAFLFFGIYLTYRIRNAKADWFREKMVLFAAIYIEVIVSFVIYAIRHTMRLSLGPDFVFFLFFIRCQLTVSGILILVFGPKLWYHYRPPDPSERPHTRHFSSFDVHDHLPEAMKLHEAIMSNCELDLADINLSDMDPEDITAELRRVYTHLQVLRNKTMRKDNPHISKRRGGRKVTHRRFSLQAFHKHKQHHHDYDHEFTEISKTPEESVASVEGAPLQGDGPSIRNEDIMAAASVSFKNGLK